MDRDSRISRAVPGLSIIVPHSGNTGPVENTLASVLQNRPADSEVLLVHPGTYDDPYDLAGEVRFIEVPASSTPVESLNLAVQAAAGDYIHVIRPGVEVEEFWSESAIAGFHDPKVAAVCPLILKREKPQLIAEAGVKLSRLGQRRSVGAGAKNRFSKVAKLNPIGPSFNAAFYRRDALERIGWLATDVGARIADIDLALSLVQAGYACRFEPECVLWLVEKGDEPAAASSLASGRQSERMLWRHAPILGGRRHLASRLAIVAAQVGLGVTSPKKFGQSLGRVLAWFEVASYRRFWRELAVIRDEELRIEDSAQSIRQLPETSHQVDAAHSALSPTSKAPFKRAS